jgi:hypothetical protein
VDKNNDSAVKIKDGYSLLLPVGMLDYFEIERVDEQSQEIHIHLCEKNEVPAEYNKEKVLSKGFFTPVRIQDFPVRGKQLYLHVHRRRWLLERTNEYVTRDWGLVAKGTRMTQEFASFLKELCGFSGSQL